MKQTLEQKQQEKQRLLRAYKRKQREKWAEITQQEPRLLSLQKALKTQGDPRALLAWLADSWVRVAPDEVRYAALRLLDAHANKMAAFEGRRELDDPLPPQRNFYLVARELLAVR